MSSSKSHGFSSSELAALSAWNLPDISEHTESCLYVGKSEVVNIEEELAPILTVDEIEATQKQAYDEAFAQGKNEGYQQGFEQGFNEGSKKGYEENVELLHNKTALFASLMESLSDPFKTLDEEVEKELVKLSIGIATQIIRREIRLDPGQIIASVREAIQVLPLSSQKIQLYLHPEDAELVRSTLSLDEMSTAWTVVEDPLITRGGCKVDTDVSHVDATIESRLAAVIASLLGGEREHDCKDSGDVEQGAAHEKIADDCRDAGGRATQGAVAEDTSL